MKCYSDRLRELATEVLKERIKRQKQICTLAQKELDTLDRILKEREK